MWLYLSGTAETKLEPDVKHEIKTEQVISDTSKELLKVFESLPIRERVKLLNMVYEFEEDYRNKEK